MPSKKKKYNARFPPARIKKIMQTDEDVGKISAAVPVIISRVLELFVESLITKSGETTLQRNSRTLSTSHIKQTILSEKKFEFLSELVLNIPDISAADDEQDGAGTATTTGAATSLESVTVGRSASEFGCAQKKMQSEPVRRASATNTKPKTTVAKSQPLTAPDGVTIIKRPRGRPKKIRPELSEVDEKKSNSQPRGRRKKVIPAVDDDDDDDEEDDSDDNLNSDDDGFKDTETESCNKSEQMSRDAISVQPKSVVVSGMPREEKLEKLMRTNNNMPMTGANTERDSLAAGWHGSSAVLHNTNANLPPMPLPIDANWAAAGVANTMPAKWTNHQSGISTSEIYGQSSSGVDVSQMTMGMFVGCVAGNEQQDYGSYRRGLASHQQQGTNGMPLGMQYSSVRSVQRRLSSDCLSTDTLAHENLISNPPIGTAQMNNDGHDRVYEPCSSSNQQQYLLSPQMVRPVLTAHSIASFNTHSSGIGFATHRMPHLPTSYPSPLARSLSTSSSTGTTTTAVSYAQIRQPPPFSKSPPITRVLPSGSVAGFSTSDKNYNS